MARRAPTRSRPAARRRTPARTPRTPRRARLRQELFTADQRRELSGVGLLGAGAVLAVVLLIPGGGSVAGPVRDAFFTALGVGAWLAAAGLGVTGARLLQGHEWRRGMVAAIGSTVTVLAVLGFLGLVAAGSAGVVGNKLGPGVGDRLGGPASAVLMLVAASLGLVLAVDLRIAPVMARLREVLASDGEEPGLKRERQSRFNAATDVDLTGVAAPVFVPPPVAPVTEPTDPFTGITDPLFENVEPLNDEGFVREFEGKAEPVLGPIPEVVLAHAAELEEGEKVWVLPTPDLLDTVAGKRERLNAEVERNKQTIVSTLRSFGIETRIIGESVGPTVTQYELQPAAGVPVRKIVGYQTDLSLALAAPIRIQPFIPGKSAVGIEVPNKAAQLVALKEIVQSPAFTDTRTRLAVALGADVSGHPVAGDLTRMPHMLIAGATGSGKSVCINAVLGGFLLQATPAELKLILIDPKRVELSNFSDLPHLLVPVVVEPEAAVASLRWAVKEMEERYKLFASHGARNIAAFNERAPGLGLSALPYTVIVIDELADLMMVAAGEIEDLICRIAQLARAVGIHLVVATQRPSADIITGLIKANIPSRVAFAVSSGTDSRVILDEMGAEKLLGRGDMLYLPIDQGKAQRLQGAFVSDRELDALIGHWKAQGKPDYQEEIFQVEASVSWAREAGKRDVLFAKAAHIVAAEGRAAASLLQRKMNVGYTRAARLVDQLAEHRIVGPYEGSKSREVLMDVIQVDEYLAELGEE
jgi:DNA segregation ATPase FtsK/SpoIIIE, S-DNA-T family